MSTTYTLVKVGSNLGGDTRKIPGTAQQAQGARYRYEMVDNAGKILILESPDATLLTAGANTGTIVITDTP